MSVETLRAAITERARELRTPVLMAAGVRDHKKKWRDCPCSWCTKKREATVVIGSRVPLFPGVYVSREGMRDIWRERKRKQYRKELAQLEKV